MRLPSALESKISDLLTWFSYEIHRAEIDNAIEEITSSARAALIAAGVEPLPDR